MVTSSGVWVIPPIDVKRARAESTCPSWEGWISPAALDVSSRASRLTFEGAEASTLSIVAGSTHGAPMSASTVPRMALGSSGLPLFALAGSCGLIDGRLGRSAWITVARASLGRSRYVAADSASTSCLECRGSISGMEPAFCVASAWPLEGIEPANAALMAVSLVTAETFPLGRVESADTLDDVPSARGISLEGSTTPVMPEAASALTSVASGPGARSETSVRGSGIDSSEASFAAIDCARALPVAKDAAEHCVSCPAAWQAWATAARSPSPGGVRRSWAPAVAAKDLSAAVGAPRPDSTRSGSTNAVTPGVDSAESVLATRLEASSASFSPFLLRAWSMDRAVDSSAVDAVTGTTTDVCIRLTSDEGATTTTDRSEYSFPSISADTATPCGPQVDGVSVHASPARGTVKDTSTAPPGGTTCDLRSSARVAALPPPPRMKARSWLRDAGTDACPASVAPASVTSRLPGLEMRAVTVRSAPGLRTGSPTEVIVTRGALAFPDWGSPAESSVPEVRSAAARGVCPPVPGRRAETCGVRRR